MERKINKDKILENKTLIVILGPTASGKTAVSIKLSEKLDAEVISADSRQIYKYLDIGTAKPSQEELNAVPTHFVDILEPDEYYSAGLFGNQAEKVAEEIINRANIPLVVGGSGLYIKALCDGLFIDNSNPKNKRHVSNLLLKELDENGLNALYEKLKKYDPESAEKYSDKNARRIFRALEHYYTTGEPISHAHITKKNDRDFNVIYFGIEIPRGELYNRINSRAEKMWETGLVKETKKILNMGFSPELNSLNTVGYKETIAFLNKKLSKNQVLEKIKQNTRHYAKRQMTWFRKVENVHWLSGSTEDIRDEILKKLNFERIIY